MNQLEDAYDDVWRDERFLTTVEPRAGIASEEAERTMTATATATDHARAVIATLREPLPPNELSDLLARLPRGYHGVLLTIPEPAR
jgi:uncharacterized protein (DUF2267 family)